MPPLNDFELFINLLPPMPTLPLFVLLLLPLWLRPPLLLLLLIMLWDLLLRSAAAAVRGSPLSSCPVDVKLLLIMGVLLVVSAFRDGKFAGGRLADGTFPNICIPCLRGI